MSHPFHRKSRLIRALSAVAALVVTVSIVQGLDTIADHSSAATMASAKAPILVAKR